jgi:hypothetical protein
MRGFHNGSFDPQTLVLIESAFELARCVLRVAMEGERDPVQLHDWALNGLLPATTWREAR